MKTPYLSEYLTSYTTLMNILLFLYKTKRTEKKKCLDKLTSNIKSEVVLSILVLLSKGFKQFNKK